MCSVTAVRWTVLFLALVTMLGSALGSFNQEQPHILRKRQQPRDRGGARNRNRNDFRRFLQQGGPSDWTAYAPTPPSQDQVECQVIIHRVQRHGGRCVRLGTLTGPAVCQSGIYLDFGSGQCNAIMAARTRAPEAAGSDGNDDYNATTTTDQEESYPTSP